MTVMKSALVDPVVTRLDLPEHFSSEPDNTALYIPKGRERDQRTSNMPRFTLPQNVYGPIRNLAIVCCTESASTVERLRCWEQLKRCANDGDEMAQTVVTALRGLVIE
jgi:hypothetical protein